MNKKRCALVAAVIVAVCTVAFLCRNRPSAEAEGTVLSSVSAPSVKTPVVASSGVAPTPVLQPSSNQTATVRGTKPYVLVSEMRFNKPLRLAAEALGARTIGVKSVHALLIEADPATRARLVADGRFVSVDEYHPADKIAPALAAAIRGGAESVEAGIMTLTPEDHRIVLERVVAMGGEVLTGCLNDGGVFRARLPAGCVAELASRGDVRWLELFERPHLTNNLAPDPELMNVRASWLSEENPGGLSGAGQIITTSDSGIDSGDTETMHPDLSDRVVGIKVVEGCSPKDVNGHGTHTAGSIVGTGAMWTNETEAVVRGMAWGAQLWAWFCGVGGSGIRTPQSMSELFRPDQENYPAYIHSASWGSDTKGSYTSQCISLDRYVWANPDFLPVFAAGNDGRNGAVTVGSPAAAKNVLTVGATQSSRIGYDGGWGNGDPQKTAVFSSRGPCMDGRIKPDIATPGVGVLSTRSHGVNYSYGIYDDYYAYDSGTSMACPLMAGATALVREWLLKPEQGFTDENPPSSALMKAIITGGAKDAAVPNNDQGWGRFDLKETLFPSNRAVYLVDKIPFESEESFGWIVETTNNAPFDVQLVWVDYPGEPGDDGSPKLINDLDLTVERMDGDDAKVLYGNGGTGPDATNNLESVRIASAEPNRYLVTVNCKDILFDYEDGGAAALYIRGAFDPGEVKEAPTTIRIRETDLYYRSLDAALAEVKPDETIEILGEARLKNSFMVTNSFAITATNANPWASLVDFRNGAQLMITNGAAVTFENVALVSNGRTQVRVFDGSCARLSGAFGIDRIQTDNWSCLELATVITNAVEVDCLAAPGVTAGQNLVAWSDLDPVTMSASANHLLNPFNEEYGGAATVGTAFGKDVPTLVFWQDGAPVPAAAAAVKLVEPGEDPVNYRTLSALVRHLAKSGDTTAYVIRDTVMTNAVDVSGWSLVLVAPDANRAVDLSGRAGFTVGADGSLAFTNVTFSGKVDGSLVEVDGGAFTLEADACIRGLVGNVAAIAITSGTMTMRPGSAIIGCQANGTGAMGGAIAMGGEGCVLNLEGGGITECYAAMFGGGVYAGCGAEINLSGPLTVYRNSSGNGDDAGVYDDICVFDGCEFTLKDNLTGGRVGVSYPYGAPDEGEPFIANAIGAAVTGHTLACFVNEDLYPTDYKAMEAALSEDEQSLIWVKADYSPDTERAEDHVAQIVLKDGAVTNYFRYIDGPDGAFAAIEALGEDGLAVELLKTNLYVGVDLYDTVQVSRDVTLRLADEVPGRADAVVYRTGSCGFEVLPGGKLTVDGVKVCGYYQQFGKNSTKPLLHVKGGMLVLTNDTLITDVECKANRGVGAVDVSDNGTFAMTEGVEIRNCINTYVNEGDQTGVGAGLLVDKGTAYLLGGTITGNSAYRAAGVFIGNEGVLHVSGNTTVTGNKTLRIDGRGGDKSDIVLEDYGQLYLDGELSGGDHSMGIAEGIISKNTDTNVFGRVVDDLLPEIQNYVASAAMFFRDAQETVTGRIATNATEALLVWSSAMPNGVYTNANGEVYGRVDDPLPPPPPPEPMWEVVTNHPTPIAFKSIDRVSDTEWTLVITDRVEYCNYRLIWTDDLTKGFTSTGDWEHAVGEAAIPQWTTNVITTGGAWFWRAEGADGTNMVLKTEE